MSPRLVGGDHQPEKASNSAGVREPPAFFFWGEAPEKDPERVRLRRTSRGVPHRGSWPRHHPGFPLPAGSGQEVFGTIGTKKDYLHFNLI